VCACLYCIVLYSTIFIIPSDSSILKSYVFAFVNPLKITKTLSDRDNSCIVHRKRKSAAVHTVGRLARSDSGDGGGVC